MALVVADRVKETTTTTGTGTLTLGGAVTGFQSFAAIGNANTTYYAISSTGSSEWEVGIGTYNSVGPALTRDTILASSNSGNAVNLSAGTKEVFVVYPAGRAIFADGTNIQVPNNAVLPITAGGTGSNTATFSGANISSLNASSISTGTLDNARTSASSANGASTIVARDASGNFSANTVTANLTGTAANATVLQTARTIAISGGATGTATSFDGSSNITIPVTALNVSTADAGTLAVARGGTGITSVGTSGNVLTSNGSAWVSQAASAAAPTTAQVLSAYAGATAGDVGTHSFMCTTAATGALAIGSTRAGSGLRSGGLESSGTTGTPGLEGNGTTASGTWRLMGQGVRTDSKFRTSVWLRIS